MSRFDNDYEPEYNNAWDLWNASLNQHLGGAKGQQALRELRDALLAMPEKCLIAGRLADEQGHVCTVGALALHRRVSEGEPREKVLADLAALIPDDDCGKAIGLKNAADRCPKCSSVDVATTFHQDRWRCDPYSRYTHNSAAGEHLHKFCRGCRYDWTQPCADARAAVGGGTDK